MVSTLHFHVHVTHLKMDRFLLEDLLIRVRQTSSADRLEWLKYRTLSAMHDR